MLGESRANDAPAARDSLAAHHQVFAMPMCRSLSSLVAAVGLVVMLAACARVHPHIALPPLSLGEPSFFPTLEAYASAPIVGGNSAEFLLNGEQIFPSILEAIRSAKKTITYAQYF